MPVLSQAYWIHPNGTILDVGLKNHIDMVVAAPTKFGETDKSVRATYEKYNEKVGFEGKAREEIMVRVMQRGYVRIREYRSHWSVQLNKLTSKAIDTIWMWAKQVIGKVRDKYADVKIQQLSKTGKGVITTSLQKVADGGGVFEGRENFESYLETSKYKIVTDIEDFPEYTE